jgi:uncharacterized ion transporter superfamily protein YfcC
MIQLAQDELKVIVGILQQVQLVYKDSKVVNTIIEKLDSHIEKPKAEDVKVNHIEQPPVVEGEKVN